MKINAPKLLHCIGGTGSRISGTYSAVRLPEASNPDEILFVDCTEGEDAPENETDTTNE